MFICSLNYAFLVRETPRKKNKIIIVLTFKQLKIMKMNYVAPELEVLEVMVEQGFAGSGVTTGGATVPGEDEVPF